MTRFFLPLLMLVTPAVSIAGAIRQPASKPPVYVVLIGYDRAPELPPLAKVYADIVQMHRFFAVLDPEEVFVHASAQRLSLEPGSDQITDVRPPTLGALRRTAADLVTLLEAAPADARIYIFYAGHGRRRVQRGHFTTEVYLAPEDGGHDGRLSASQLAEDILEPLADRADIHLIIDACQSYFVLESRGIEQLEAVPKRPGTRLKSMERRFNARFPRVGVMTAAVHPNAYEDPSLGGLFSFALRSSAVGHADLNGDGRITYREMEVMIRWILHTRLGPVTPGILGPGGDDDRVFIDYRESAARRIQFPAGWLRYVLLDENGMPQLVAYPRADRSETIYLPEGEVYHAVGTQPGTELRRDFIISAGSRQLEPAPAFGASERGPAALFGQPPPLDIDEALPQPDATWIPPYASISLAVGVQGYPAALPGDFHWGPTIEIGGAVGRSRLQGAARLRYGRWRADGGLPTAEAVYTAHHIDVALGAEYHAVSGGDLEGTVGLELGGGPVMQHNDLADEWRFAATIVPAVRARLTFPAPGLGWPMFVEGYTGLRMLAPVEDGDALLAPTLGLLVGCRLERVLAY